MNWKIGFFVSTIAFLVSLFWGINRTTNTPCTSATEKDDRIPADTAVLDTNAYAAFRDNIDGFKNKKAKIAYGKDSVDAKVLEKQMRDLRGFKLAPCELSEILWQAGPDAQVWALLCVKQKPKKKGEGADIKKEDAKQADIKKSTEDAKQEDAEQEDTEQDVKQEEDKEL